MATRSFSPPGSPAVPVLLGVTLGAWFIAVAWASLSGALRAVPLPMFALLVAAGIVLPTIAHYTLASMREYLERLGLHVLTLLHVWRVPAALLFFHYGALGELPPLFWILAGVGDLIAGAYAARLFFRAGDKDFYRRFHRFGFADFVVAVGTGLAFTLLQDPRMAAIAQLPLAWIPLFGVGISGASHLVAFDLLRRGVGGGRA